MPNFPKKFLNEFKEFALRGNVMDLAVGVIIGGAFQAIIKSLTDDIISPILGLFASTNFTSMVLPIRGVDIKYGSFITCVINFIIMALIIFMLVKGMNILANLGRKRHEEPPKPATKTCPFCCSEVPEAATRCPHCTSVLEETASTKAAI